MTKGYRSKRHLRDLIIIKSGDSFFISRSDHLNLSQEVVPGSTPPLRLYET